MEKIRLLLKLVPIIMVIGFISMYIQFPKGTEQLPEHMPDNSIRERDYVLEQQTVKVLPDSAKMHIDGRHKIDIFNETVNQTGFDISDCVRFRVYESSIDICVYPSEIDNMVSASLRHFGTWEEDFLNETGSVFVKHKNWIFIDLGCNIGVYTLFVAKLGAKVIAVDPNKANLRLLAKSLDLAKLRHKVTMIANGMSDEYIEVVMDIPKGNVGGAHIKQAVNASTDVDGSTDRNIVWTIQLNDLTDIVGNNDVFLKVDIESYEERLLNGGHKFLQSVNVRGILMEWVHHRYKPSGANIVSILVRNGFLPYEDVYMNTPLDYGREHAWPENVFWIKR